MTVPPINAWGPVRSALRNNFTTSRIMKFLGQTGIDVTSLSSISDNDALMVGIDRAFVELDVALQKRFLFIMIEELASNKPHVAEELSQSMSRLGWQIRDGDVILTETLDLTELLELPPASHHDLLMAAKRLRDGELNEAIGAACGAVDSITGAIWEEKNLGDAGRVSFQESVIKSLNALQVEETLKAELESIGWGASDAKIFCNNLRKSLNQASYVMQKLRSDMGNAHGSKPVIRALAFDSIKWAELILRLLSPENTTAE